MSAEEFQAETTKIHRSDVDVFIPLTSFLVYGSFAKEDPHEQAVIANKYPIPDSSLEFCVLNKRLHLDELAEFSISEKLSMGSRNLRLKKMFQKSHRHTFNSGILLKYPQPDPNQFLLFPHQIENAARNAVILFRLYVPGDLFAPYALIDNKDIAELHGLSSGDQSHQLSSLHYTKLPKLLEFCGRYHFLIENLRKKYEGGDAVSGNWYKRINNALFFFNSTYFAQERNTINQEAREGNNLRLIYLCTALDSLLGDGNTSAKKLAEDAAYVLGKIKSGTKDDIGSYYADRSNYVHAHPAKIKSYIMNKPVQDFSVYIQKLILISLELSGDKEFCDLLATKKATHWFRAFKEESSERMVREAVKRVIAHEDEYELANKASVDYQLKMWEPRNP